jgi:hypothetical protein
MDISSSVTTTTSYHWGLNTSSIGVTSWPEEDFLPCAKSKHKTSIYFPRSLYYEYQTRYIRNESFNTTFYESAVRGRGWNHKESIQARGP